MLITDENEKVAIITVSSPSGVCRMWSRISRSAIFIKMLENRTELLLETTCKIL